MRHHSDSHGTGISRLGSANIAGRVCYKLVSDPVGYLKLASCLEKYWTQQLANAAAGGEVPCKMRRLLVIHVLMNCGFH